MENSLVKGLPPKFKSNYLRLIAAGHVEATALATLNVDWLDFFEACSKDVAFRKEVDDARKNRADVWVDRIAVSVDHKYVVEVEKEGVLQKFERPPTKDELGRDKLNFEKLKFLAQADNPDKYANGAKTKINMEFDIAEFKLLTIEESRNVLAADPFAQAIDAEFTQVTKEPSND